MAETSKVTTSKLDVNNKDSSGYTLLHKVVMKDNQYCPSNPVMRVEEKDVNNLKLLLKFHPDINIINALTSEGENILHLAIKYERSLEMVKIITKALLDNGVDINLADKKGYTAFYYAISPIKFNYQKGNSYSPKKSDFNFKFMDAGIIEHLVEKGAMINQSKLDVNNKDRSGYTLLHKVVMKDDQHCPSNPVDRVEEKDVNNLKLLLKFHADINIINALASEGENILHLAIKNERSLEMVKIITKALLDHDVDINLADKKGFTPLYYAVWPISFNYQQGNSYCPKYSDFNFKFIDVAIVQHLVENGANINIIDKNGYSPLLLSVVLRKTDYVRVLLEHKDKLSEGALEKTARNYFCELDKCYPNYKLVQYPPKEYLGMTLLMIAIQDNNKDMAQLLVEAGATINVRDGQYALQMIIHGNCLPGKEAADEQAQIAKLLIDSGIDLNAGSLLHHALNYNKQDIVTYMLQKGLDTL